MGSERPERQVPSRAPAIDEDVREVELDPEVRRSLGSLSTTAAARVARHLVMAGRLLEAQPDLAVEHALAARAVPGATRLPAVREAVGLALYAAGRYADALPELRAARRISGSDELLPVIADAERGAGRPERALQLAAEAGGGRLAPHLRAELLVVAAGAHRDLGRLDAALATLRVAALRTSRQEEWVARLRYAYADALAAAGDRDEALRWFAAAAAADPEGTTDAGDRVAALEGVVFLVEDEPDSLGDSGGEPGARPAPPAS